MQPSFSTSSALFGSIGICRCLCQSITRSAGNNSQCGISMHQRTSYFIDCPVPTDSHYYISLLFGSFSSYFYCMTGSFRIHYFPRVSRLVYFFVQQVKNQFFTLCSRNRIDDEFYFFILSFMLFLSIVDDKSNINILNFNLLEVSNHMRATFFS